MFRHIACAVGCRVDYATGQPPRIPGSRNAFNGACRPISLVGCGEVGCPNKNRHRRVIWVLVPGVHIEMGQIIKAPKNFLTDVARGQHGTNEKPDLRFAADGFEKRTKVAYDIQSDVQLLALYGVKSLSPLTFCRCSRLSGCPCMD